ncbi:Non-specific lipid-transfer protein 1 [Hordeum vulgare]|nr:Non-specific lipid-transfer protein 1 [Hordeum vulgare]
MTPTRHSPAVVAVALLLAVLAAGRRGAEAGGDKSDCSVAQTAFSECTGYVAGLDDEVPPQCCQGLGDLKDMAPGAGRRPAQGPVCVHPVGDARRRQGRLRPRRRPPVRVRPQRRVPPDQPRF